MDRKLYLLNAVAALAVSGIFAGCTNEPIEPDKPQPPQEKPEFVIEDSNFSDLSHEGTTLMVNYYVENPVEGARIVFNTDQVDWVGDVSADDNGTITIEVLPNDSQEPRAGEIVVSYVYVMNDEESALYQSILLGQLAAPEPPVPFVIDIDEAAVTHNSVSAFVTPYDAEMTYIVMTVGKEYYDIYLGDEDVLYTMVLNQYISAAAGEGISIEDFFERHEVLKTGESQVVITDLEAETEYYIFAVGMSTSGAQLSDFVFGTFTTLEIPVAPAAFDFEISIEGTSGSINIIPHDADLYYYADIISVKVFDETIMYWDDYAQSLIDESVDLYMGLGVYDSVEDIVKDICYHGEHEMPVYLLSPNSDYYVYAFGVGFDGLVSTEVCTDTFTTGEEMM